MSEVQAPDEFILSTKKELLDLEVIHGFLSTCYWSPGIVKSRVQRAIGNSMCFGLFHAGSPALNNASRPRQIGFARVITDKATFGYIADVFVLEEFRGRGLSKRLMKAIVEHPELQGLRRLCLMTRDAHGLYAQFGFAPMPDPARYMEVVDRESYKQD